MILFYFIFVSFAACTHGIHEHMTKREIQSTFNVDQEKIHEVEYEVTPVYHIDQLNGKGQKAQSAVRFRAFNTDISLYLLENDNSLLGKHTPLFIAERSRRAGSFDAHPQIVYSRKQFPMPENLKFYHDMQNRAAVTVFTDDDNKAHVYGTIGEDYIVKPMPTRLQKEILPKYPHLNKSSFSYERSSPFSDDSFFKDPFSGDSLSGNHYQPTHHIVIKQKVQANSSYDDPTERRWKNMKKQWHHIDSDESDENVLSDESDESDENDLSDPSLHSMNKTQHSDPRRPSAQIRPSQRPFRRFRQRKPILGRTNIVYPELLVSIDYETYVAHGHDLNELAKYMAAFWNAVDLRFRELRQPKVRLNIAGLVVPLTRDSSPYFEKSRVNSKALDADKTVSDIGSYFAHEDYFPKNMYDIAVAISHLDLGSFEPNGKFHGGITGIAMLKGACKVQTGQAATLIRDTGGFNGITTAAHELAHSMGALHDGSDTDSFSGGPCPWSDGFLMSYDRKDSNGMHWSQCSIIAMTRYLSSPEAECMKNKPVVDTPYPKILPGKVLSRDEQCSKSMGDGWFSDKKQESNCAVLHCRKQLSATRVLLMHQMRPPAEGSDCGPKAICLNAKCVEVPRNYYMHT